MNRLTATLESAFLKLAECQHSLDCGGGEAAQLLRLNLCH